MHQYKMISIIDTNRAPAQQTRLDRLALLLSRHVADARQAKDQESSPCCVVASITPAKPPQYGNSNKQQLQIQLRSSCLCCSDGTAGAGGGGTADAGGGQSAQARLRQVALPPYVQAVYTVQNSELGLVTKVRQG